MNTLFKNQLEQISRREFLQITGTTLLASFWLPFFNIFPSTHLDSVTGEKPARVHFNCGRDSYAGVAGAGSADDSGRYNASKFPRQVQA